MDRQVARVHPQTEWSDVEFTEFDASTNNFLDRRDHAAPNPLLKGIGGHVPAEQAEGNQAKQAKT